MNLAKFKQALFKTLGGVCSTSIDCYINKDFAFKKVPQQVFIVVANHRRAAGSRWWWWEINNKPLPQLKVHATIRGSNFENYFISKGNKKIKFHQKTTTEKFLGTTVAYATNLLWRYRINLPNVLIMKDSF